MAVSPTGEFCHAHLGALLLAETTAWQTATGETDRDGGMEHIVTWGADDRVVTSKQSTPPRAVFEDPEDYKTQIVGTKSFAHNASVPMSIELPVTVDGSTVVTLEDERNTFMNTIGAIISEMRTQAGQGESLTGRTHLNVREFHVESGPFRTSPEEHPDYADLRTESGSVPFFWGITYLLLVHG